ncbi:unnamed protein product [Cladocopium goreaui]|uniref:Uncharacterized protein n=1 Tax=Cladocopium goreaui TaxID=2562237 RepID=A0A9P1C5J5_9DINO|nr:unnamed protein product [Cladocopium goreaui]
MQLCLPWAPDWFQPKALGCNYAEHVALYGRLSVMLWLLLYGGLGGLLAWALQRCLQGKLWRPVQALLLCAVCCLPWALVAFSWELAHDHNCWNSPRICGKGKNR